MTHLALDPATPVAIAIDYVIMNMRIRKGRPEQIQPAPQALSVFEEERL